MTRVTGYILVATATTLWGLNAPVSKVVLDNGLDAGQLTQVRATGTFIALAAILLATRPHVLKASPRQMAYLILFGLIGLNAVQVLYFLAIRELPVGVALLVQYIAPVLVALYARFWLNERSGPSLWAAIALVLLGLALMVELFSGELTLSSLGLSFAFMSALTYSIYILMTERIIHERPPVATICWGFGVAAVFWSVVNPWWGFPWGELGDSVGLGGRLDTFSLPLGALVVYVVVAGTLIPFALLVSALHALPASRVSLLSTWEPVAGGLIAWLWLEEALSTGQVVGAFLVLTGILIAESATSLQISH